MVKDINSISSVQYSPVDIVTGNDDFNILKKHITNKKKQDHDYREDIEIIVAKTFPTVFKVKTKYDNHGDTFLNHKITKENEIYQNVNRELSSKRMTVITNEMKHQFNNSFSDEITTHSMKLPGNLDSLNLENKEIAYQINSRFESKEKKISHANLTSQEVGHAMNIVSTMSHLSAKTNVKNSNDELLTDKIKALYTHKLQSSKGDVKNLSLNYPFQSWSGEHSVKVTLPITNNIQRNVVLQPSDTRTCDILAKQLNTLSIQDPELLRPQQDKEQKHGQHRNDYESQEDES